MAEATADKKTTRRRSQLRRLRRWLLADLGQSHPPPGKQLRREAVEHTHPWWQVMCLTGVDYFSTLGYQPGIAIIAAGALSPIATIVLVVVTLFGALPMYNRVARESPHGQGSIAMLENLLARWKGKALVLILLGFAATAFVITITLSAADATAHIVENPYAPHWLHHPVAVTSVLLLALGAVFLKGFKEAIGIAVAIVVVYLALNVVVIGRAFMEIWAHPDLLANWKTALLTGPGGGNPMLVLGYAMLAFPQLALGLSGFETGVAVMPLVKGDPGDTHDRPEGRIRNARKLLAAAALIMSVMLMTSSFVTTLLVPRELLLEGGEAEGRALSYVCHTFLGDTFGTVYDLSTIAILWFAGASAMAGLINLVPRYLPRYGMAPEWARATRPLVVVFTAITLVVTAIFHADVERQAGAYATGVLVFMTSGAFAVTLAVWRESLGRRLFFGAVLAVFLYATALNIFERPEGLKIALIFIVGIIISSLVSRVARSTELRIHAVEMDPTAEAFVREASAGTIRIVANRPDAGDEEEYRKKEHEARTSHHIPAEQPILILEIQPGDASEFSDVLEVHGVRIGPYRVLRTESPAIPNAIAALLLHVRDMTGQQPHVYFGWTEGNPIAYVLKFIAFGEGDTAPVTREVLRQTIDDPTQRPRVHVG
jgi:hypothetical protein